MPVPYCLDDCGFVVQTEVRQVDSSSSILLSQDCFGYSRFFVFPFKLCMCQVSFRGKLSKDNSSMYSEPLVLHRRESGAHISLQALEGI